MISTNETVSDFQLVESFISECQFQNRLIALGGDTVLTNHAEVAVSKQILNAEKTMRLGYVRVSIDGCLEVQENKDARCDFKLVVEGEFTVPVSCSEEKFNQQLWINGTSVLYGIVRAKMEVLSSTVFGKGKITLPLINMIDFVNKQNEEVRKNLSNSSNTPTSNN